MSPGVSIVIPCYNQGHYLGEAIRSALTQKCPPSEIIVVNDGSTDETADVMSSHSGIVTLTQPNLGLAAARNAGLARARGDFVLFLDADDRLLPDAVCSTRAALQQNAAAAFAFGSFRLIGASGEDLGKPPHAHDFDAADPFSSFLRGNHAGMHSNVLYRRAALLEARGFRPADGCEDYDVFLRLSRDHDVVALDDVIAEYRQHGASMSRNVMGMAQAALRVLEQQRSLAQSQPHLRRAFADGQRRWRDHYAERLLRDAARSLLAGGWPRARRSLADFVRLAGVRVPVVIALALLPPALRVALRSTHRSRPGQSGAGAE